MAADDQRRRRVLAERDLSANLVNQMPCLHGDIQPEGAGAAARAVPEGCRGNCKKPYRYTASSTTDAASGARLTCNRDESLLAPRADVRAWWTPEAT